MAECLKINRGGAGSESLKIVSWQNSTDEEVAAMIAAADAGQINLNDYWTVGDKRLVHLSAMTTGQGLCNAQPEQDVIFVLMDTGINSGYKDVNDNYVNFVVGQESCLSNTGRMYSTDTSGFGNTTSWSACNMRTDLNSIYYNALPETFRNCLKQFKTIAGVRPYSGTQTTNISNDYVALFAEKEVFGNPSPYTAYAIQAESNALKQIDYYSSSSNRIKYINNSITAWIERSPRSNNPGNFCAADVASDNTPRTGVCDSNQQKGIAPFFCI